MKGKRVTNFTLVNDKKEIHVVMYYRGKYTQVRFKQTNFLPEKKSQIEKTCLRKRKSPAVPKAIKAKTDAFSAVKKN